MQQPDRLMAALGDLTAVVERLERAAAQASADDAARLADLLAANAAIGVRLEETAAVLRTMSGAAAALPNEPA